MKIGIFDPYLDTLGGGEKYIFSIVKCLAENNDVFIFWKVDDERKIKSRAEERFGVDLSGIRFTDNIFDKNTSFIKRMLRTRNFDVIIFLSNGSIPLLLAKKNILLFQFPVNWVDGKKFLTRLKLRKINKVICYSNFVKNYLDKTFLINSLVLSPYVEEIGFKYSKKENIILTVGRFTKSINTKKQEVLIDAFKKVYKKEFIGWKLFVIGSVLPGDISYVKDLKNRTRDFPIEVLENVSISEINNYYKRAKIYWHASGFGENLEKHPERAEHFGISTVEAMMAGSVPVVIKEGGQKEIIDDGENGFLWSSLDELIKKTKSLMEDRKLWMKMSEEAVKKAKTFSEDRFCKELSKLINT